MRTFILCQVASKLKSQCFLQITNSAFSFSLLKIIISKFCIQLQTKLKDLLGFKMQNVYEKTYFMATTIIQHVSMVTVYHQLLSDLQETPRYCMTFLKHFLSSSPLACQLFTILGALSESFLRYSAGNWNHCANVILFDLASGCFFSPMLGWWGGQVSGSVAGLKIERYWVQECSASLGQIPFYGTTGFFPLISDDHRHSINPYVYIFTSLWYMVTSV